jgi:hypothetical protein
MIKRNSANERVKRRYLQHLKETKGRDESSLDAVAKAIDRFEDYSKFRDFKKFHVEQVRAFKVHLRTTRNVRTGQPLSASNDPSRRSRSPQRARNSDPPRRSLACDERAERAGSELASTTLHSLS